MKNAGMAGAVALVGIGLLSIGIGRWEHPAHAKTHFPSHAGDLPKVVDTAFAFDPAGVSDAELRRPTQVFRLWSNGAIDFRNASNDWYEIDGCTLDSFPGCPSPNSEEWIPFNPALSGFIATQDMNGDRKIDAEDLGLILANWGPTSAALLFNPDSGQGLPIALECNWIRATHPPNLSEIDLMIYRSWDTGLIEMAWVTEDDGADCLPNSKACWEGWRPIPGSLPITNATGDFNRSGQTDAGDLGQLLGSWTK